MKLEKTTITDIDSYIALQPAGVQALLQQVREAIHEAAPDANEVISYGMPAFSQHGVLVYFAAFKNHIGFYPTASGIKAFEQELAGYVWSKGAIQFPLDRPMPLNLIARIVAFRVNETVEKARQKALSGSRLKTSKRQNI